MTKMAPIESFGIIGAGKVGQTLLRYLESRSLSCSWLKDKKPVSAARLPAGHAVTALTELTSIPDIIFICVPDSALASVVAALLPLLPSAETIVAHTSGGVTSDVLQPLESAQVRIGSFHPIQSFHSSDMDVAQLQGIACGIEGSEYFQEAMKEFAVRIGWKPLVVRKEKKALYHAACVFAGNFIPVLIHEARQLLTESLEGSAPVDALMPMIRTVSGRMEDGEIEDFLTGPAVRGDAATLAEHVKQLSESSPESLFLYKALSLRIFELMKGHTLDRETFGKALSALHSDGTRSSDVDEVIPPKE
ncbi:MAG: hypothetical protein CL946_09220 [Ectothiorhodospiraceae bacterium]|nr:hypothetical protein [Ectothiorhodospiraceae bacterium]